MSQFTLDRRQILGLWAALMASAAMPGMALAAPAGRLLVAADSEPRSLNPAIVASNGVFFIASKVIEPLAEASYDGLRPLLATGWEGADDGLSVTFHLRRDVRFHDGQPLTSQDVAFSAMKVWKAMQNIGREVLANLQEVETPDPLTAVFRFSKPMPLQLLENALPVISAVLPRHIYETGDIAGVSALVGTGPFTFAEHRPGEYYLLKRNPAYWDAGQPLLEEIIYRVLPDRAAAASSLEAGEVQLACFSAVPLTDLARIGQVPGLQVVTKGYEALTYQLVVEINHRNEHLAKLAVRQAIAHAIDRDFVIRTIFQGYATAATGPVPATATQFYSSDVETHAFDPEAANRLLDQAGYPRGADGTRFALRLLPAPYFTETVQFGDYLRQALAVVGIDARIIANDSAAHQKAVYTDHAFDLAVAPPVFRGDPAISTTILVRSGLPVGVGFSNQGGFADADLDQIIDEALVTLDPARRVALYNRFQRRVTEELPLINVADWTFTSVAATGVRNIANNPRWAVSGWADTQLDG